jgi:hypothetical protein
MPEGGHGIKTPSSFNFEFGNGMAAVNMGYMYFSNVKLGRLAPINVRCCRTEVVRVGSTAGRDKWIF